MSQIELPYEDLKQKIAEEFRKHQKGYLARKKKYNYSLALPHPSSTAPEAASSSESPAAEAT
jgi:hypothetical protein